MRSIEDLRGQSRYSVEDLLYIMETLRSPRGCAWDREQTHLSLRRDFLEECYEAVEAIDTGNSDLLREELGDVLFQVVFHSCIEEEKRTFNFSDVVSDIAAKMIERHPHVFGDTTVNGTEEILANWDAIKKKTKGQKTHKEVLESVSAALPALMRCQKILKKAQKNGIVLEPNPKQELQKLLLADSLNEQEIGRLLLLAVNLSGQCGIDAEEALSKQTKLFMDCIKS